ncbi:hypothetical protein ACWEPL_53275 [Nonomuraea sp. NPDC004186]
MTDGTSARLGSVRTLRPELVGRTGELARIQEAVVDGCGLVLIDGRGAVPALDDLHWADAPSLEPTEFLLRHPPAAGFLPAIACRSTMIPPAVADAVARQDAYITRLSPSPLDEETAATLMPAVDASDQRRQPPENRRLGVGTGCGSPPRSAPCRPAHGELTAPRSAPFWSARRDRGSGSRPPPSGRSSGGIRRPG